MGGQAPVAVVTGASSGIGLATAVALAAEGWRVIGLGRDPGRTAEAVARIRAVATRPVDMLLADFTSLRNAERAASAVAALTDRIDVLVNNAGGMTKQKIVTPEGFEAGFVANHLSPYLFTTQLLPLLRHAAEASTPGSVRILNTSSDASEMIPGLDFDDLQGLTIEQPGLAYCRSKLANVLFARGLARRLEGDGIVAHAMHPGYVESNFITYADEQSQAFMRGMKGQTPEEGADTLVWLATAEEPGKTNGGYFYRRAPRDPHPSAYDAALVDRLWDESGKLVDAFAGGRVK